MHQALYRKWRPQTFDDVRGQEHITSILRYETEHRAFSHAYLFCGSRGTGKTTCAKILAKAVNCESPVNGSPCGKCSACVAIDSGAATDVLEMDAASNNGVEDIRDIRDEVVYSPSNLRYRVYIIDEVHMLSVSAFNALLKTLEEPPEHVVFILATTDLQKLPATIISRCQRFDFRRISTEALTERLQYIAQHEDIRLQPDAARTIAKLAQGGMRDAISLLELCAGGRREVTVDVVEDSVGLTGRGAILRAVNAVADKQYDVIFSQISEVVQSSKDISVFWQDLISVYRDMLVVKTTESAARYLDLTDQETEELNRTASRFRKETLLYHCKLLEDAFFAMQKSNAVKRIVAEMTLVRMCDEALDTTPEALISRIAQLEERISMAPVAIRTAEPAAPAQGTVAEEPRAPAAEVPQKTEAAIAKATANEPAPAAPSAKRLLRPIRNWMEVVERVSRSTQMMASFLRNTRAFTTENDCVVVQFDNEFGMRMMEQGDSRDRLRSAVSAVLRREVTDKQLLMELIGKSAAPSVMDEIIEAAEEER